MKPALRKLLLLVALALAACGNKGDLVLPEPPEAAQQDAPPTE